MDLILCGIQDPPNATRDSSGTLGLAVSAFESYGSVPRCGDVVQLCFFCVPGLVSGVNVPIRDARAS